MSSRVALAVVCAAAIAFVVHFSSFNRAITLVNETHSTPIPLRREKQHHHDEPKGAFDYTKIPQSFVWENITMVHQEELQRDSAYFCGAALLRQFGVSVEQAFTSTDDDESVILSLRIQTNGSRIWLNGVASSATALFAAEIKYLAEKGLHQVRFDAKTLRAAGTDFSNEASFQVLVLLTWVGDRFVGQKWSLPDRNDQPPLQEQIRKCHSLTLTGSGCGRFGVPLFRGAIRTRLIASSRPHHACKGRAANSHGFWKAVPSRPLLDDVARLNRVSENQTWEWQTSVCSFQYFSRERALQCAQRGLQSDQQLRRTPKIALFGDSMIVELFYSIRAIFGENLRVVAGKNKKLRHMEFTVDGDPPVHVKFFRSYTTAQGRSVIANPKVIFDQLAVFNPNVIIGNFAVLHWQQNGEDAERWRQNLKLFGSLWDKFGFSNVTGPRFVRALYFGPTLIQMGRTQGLQPSRTAEFAAIARKVLMKVGFEFIEPFALSASRLEAAFDGQHWACYHRHGGVAHTIAQLMLNRACN